MEDTSLEKVSLVFSVEHEGTVVDVCVSVCDSIEQSWSRCCILCDRFLHCNKMYKQREVRKGRLESLRRYVKSDRETNAVLFIAVLQQFDKLVE